MFKIFRLSLLLAMGLAAAGCQTATRSPIARVEFDNPSGRPLEPGAARITISNPDKDRWLSRIEPRRQGTIARIFVCRELACPSRSAVVVETGPSPTRVVDPVALEKLAKDLATRARTDQDDVREAMGAIPIKRKILSSRVTKIEGRPAIMQEVEMEQEGRKLSSIIALMFAGPVVVKFHSVSGDLPTARKHFAEFVKAVVLVEAAPAVPPVAPTEETPPA